MAQIPLAALGQRLRQWIGRRETADCADDLLLHRFTTERDESAFAALMRRHGPLVLGVCRRVLTDASDAEDAFQATFLVLARKAASITRGEALGGWLARVACRIALAARADAVRRRRLEQQALAMKPPAATEATWDDVKPLVDEEVDRLPRKYRLPVVLCYIEGKSHDEAATQLGWPKGTVAGRLARARAMLHQRLTRRGVALSASALGVLLTQQLAVAVVPSALFSLTLQTALTESVANLAAASHAVALADGAMRSMMMTKVKLAAAMLVACGVLGVGAGTYFQTTSAAQLPGKAQIKPLPAPLPGQDAKDDRPAVPGVKGPAVPGARDDRPAAGGAAANFAAFNQAQLLFTGKVASVAYGPVGLSEPPVHSVRLTFDDVKVLRGKMPAATTFNYSVRSQQQPAFNQGEAMVVAMSEQRITAIVPATAAEVALARQAVTVPIAWTLENDKPVSPWAKLGDKAKLPGLTADVVCAKSGRPALLAGGVELKVEQVIPAVVQKFKNPFGDGEFKLTVTNPGKEAVTVPALLTDGKDILWADSILILQNGKPHILPAAGSVRTNLQAVKIPAGGSVSGIVNTLQLQGISWPRGGSRVPFQFCLGELAASDFFYYFSDLHDKMRPAATK